LISTGAYYDVGCSTLEQQNYNVVSSPFDYPYVLLSVQLLTPVLRSDWILIITRCYVDTFNVKCHLRYTIDRIAVRICKLDL